MTENEVDQLYNKAYKIAEQAHKGQKRKFGEDKDKDYIIHPIRVAERCKGLSKVAAILHDTVEDTDKNSFLNVTVRYLLDQEMPAVIVNAIVLLSKKKGDTYFDFIMRIAKSASYSGSGEIAAEVKITDLEDNMVSLSEGSMKDKYRLAKFILQKASFGELNF